MTSDSFFLLSLIVLTELSLSPSPPYLVLAVEPVEGEVTLVSKCDFTRPEKQLHYLAKLLDNRGTLLEL
jgi:hypothetical protein